MVQKKSHTGTKQMIDLHISGLTDRYPIDFTVGGTTKTVDLVRKDIHFSLEENKEYRIYFRQKNENHIPRGAEIFLSLIFLPVRGIFNVITFNTDQDWEREISAFRVSGYADVTFTENTELSFRLNTGKYDGKTFHGPEMIFSPEMSVNQTLTRAPEEIFSAHRRFLKNLASVSLLFFALFIFLLIAAINANLFGAAVFISAITVFMGGLIAFFALRSFKKRKELLKLLDKTGL